MYISIFISLATITLSTISIITNSKTARLQYDVAGMDEDIAGILSREGK